jgi:hypothetical protein
MVAPAGGGVKDGRDEPSHEVALWPRIYMGAGHPKTLNLFCFFPNGAPTPAQRNLFRQL